MEKLIHLSDAELKKRAQYFGLKFSEPINRDSLIQKLNRAEIRAQTAATEEAPYYLGNADRCEQLGCEKQESEEKESEEKESEDTCEQPGCEKEEEGCEKEEDPLPYLNKTAINKYKVGELRKILENARIAIPEGARKADLVDLYLDNMEEKPPLPLESNLETLKQIQETLHPRPINPKATFQENQPIPPPSLESKPMIIKAPAKSPYTGGPRPISEVTKPITTPPKELKEKEPKIRPFSPINLTPSKAPSEEVLHLNQEHKLPYLTEEQIKRKRIEDLKKEFKAAGINFKEVKLKRDLVKLYIKNMAPKSAPVISPVKIAHPLKGTTLAPPKLSAAIPKITPAIENEIVYEAEVPLFNTRLSPLPASTIEREKEGQPQVYTTEQMAVLGLKEINPALLTGVRVKKEEESKYWSYKDMVHIARALNLRVTGTKGELYERIMEKRKNAGGYDKD